MCVLLELLLGISCQIRFLKNEKLGVQSNITVVLMGGGGGCGGGGEVKNTIKIDCGRNLSSKNAIAS